MELTFSDYHAFESYLSTHYDSNDGLWIKFDKAYITSTLTAQEALEIALCYGWIDGLIKRIDDQYYIKYFHKRLKNSIWSTRNKEIALSLINNAKMKKPGLDAIHLAKSDGRWDKSDKLDDHIDLASFFFLIMHDELAAVNYNKMSTSVQKTYAISYFSLKREDSKKKRLSVIIDRLRQNLKPMD